MRKDYDGSDDSVYDIDTKQQLRRGRYSPPPPQHTHSHTQLIRLFPSTELERAPLGNLPPYPNP